ncbi:MAG: LysR family transcriptional regulator [Maricaulaceae bacterium]
MIAADEFREQTAMEMQQVRYFLALADKLNFTRAAEACNVTQPALTRAIQALESELGAPLFHRERARTHLSELGRMMLPHFETIRDRSEALKQEAQSFTKAEDIELKLGAMCTIGPRVLSGLIVEFHKQFEGVTLAIHDTEGRALADMVLEGKLEVGLIGLPEPFDERLHAIPLFTERFVVVLPPGHRLAEKNAIRVKDLDGEPYLNRINCEVFAPARKVFEAQGVNTPMVFRSERDDWVLGMIRAGMGWGFFPEFCTIPDDLPVRPLIEPEFDRTVSLVTMRGRPHSPAVGAFVRGARAHAWPQRTAA